MDLKNNKTAVIDSTVISSYRFCIYLFTFLYALFYLSAPESIKVQSKTTDIDSIATTSQLMYLFV